MTSPYTFGGYFIYWKFPTAAERVAYIPEPAERGKVALQEDSVTMWLATASGWVIINAAAIEAYIPTQSYDGEVIPATKQRLVSGEYEIIGTLELVGDLVLI